MCQRMRRGEREEGRERGKGEKRMKIRRRRGKRIKKRRKRRRRTERIERSKELADGGKDGENHIVHVRTKWSEVCWGELIYVRSMEGKCQVNPSSFPAPLNRVFLYKCNHTKARTSVRAH